MAGKTPLTMIKEALYSKLLELPIKDGQITNLPLDFDVAPLKLKELFHRYAAKYGLPPGISKVEDFKQLRFEMATALRHKDCNQRLLYCVIYQALEKGLPYITFGVSHEAKLLKDFAKEVSMEVTDHRTITFEYQPDAPNVIFAYCKLNYNTADLILKNHAKQFPDRTILIYTRRTAYWLKDGNFGSARLDEFNTAAIYTRQLASI